jgi:hypothetical protein
VADPLSEAYDAIIVALRSQQAIDSQVRAGNLIAFTGESSSPDKEQRTSGDLPELVLSPSGFSVNEKFSSHTAQVTVEYQLGILTGDVRINRPGAINPILWAMAGVMLKLKAIIQAADVRFLKSVTLAGGTTDPVGGSEEDEILQDRRGWIGITSMQLIFYVPHTEWNT